MERENDKEILERAPKSEDYLNEILNETFWFHYIDAEHYLNWTVFQEETIWLLKIGIRDPAFEMNAPSDAYWNGTMNITINGILNQSYTSCNAMANISNSGRVYYWSFNISNYMLGNYNFSLSATNFQNTTIQKQRWLFVKNYTKGPFPVIFEISASNSTYSYRTGLNSACLWRITRLDSWHAFCGIPEACWSCNYTIIFQENIVATGTIDLQTEAHIEYPYTNLVNDTDIYTLVVIDGVGLQFAKNAYVNYIWSPPVWLILLEFLGICLLIGAGIALIVRIFRRRKPI